jgi:hypothetical protein
MTNPTTGTERRTVRGDTVYSLEQVNSLWIVKANGTALMYPSSYEYAFEQYKAVTQ